MPESSKHLDKTAILVAAYGTAIEEAKSGYRNVERHINSVWPGVPVRWSYTSAKIKMRLGRRGLHVDNVAEALEKIRQEGFARVVVQSLHTVPGAEFEATVKTCREFERDGKFERITVGTPLLNAEEDMLRALEIIPGYIPSDRRDDEAVIIIGHGTGHSGQANYTAFIRLLQKRLSGVFAGLLEHAPEGRLLAKEVKEAGYSKALLIPFLCVPGFHVREDIAGDGPKSWKSIFIAEGMECRALITGTAEHNGFVDIWIDHLRKAVDNLAAHK